MSTTYVELDVRSKHGYHCGTDQRRTDNTLFGEVAAESQYYVAVSTSHGFFRSRGNSPVSPGRVESAPGERLLGGFET